MRAQIKEMYSLQISEAIEDFRPEVSGYFGISFRLMIGTEETDQSESFDILVCTPAWIQDQLQDEGCIWGRHMLIVESYDYEKIQQSISARISSCTGGSWDDIASKIARFAAWEFEDYQP